MKIIKRKSRLQESSGLKFGVNYVNNEQSIILYIDERNYNVAENLVDDAYKVFKKENPYVSDDIWIDSIWLEKGDKLKEKITEAETFAESK